MKHFISSLKYSRYIMALVFATAFSFGVRAQFMSIFGPTCVDAGVQYQYALTGDYPGMGINWCVTGGTIQGGTGNCRFGTNLKNVFVTWTSGTGRSLTATITSGGTGSATTNVTVTATLVAGNISNTSQTIAYGATPTTLSCSVATGGHCSPSYNYQWLSSPDNVTFNNLSGATSQNLVFTEGLTQTTYFKRKVTETTSGSIGYSNTATVNVNPPSIVPGSTSPATQMVNIYTMPPMTLVTNPATIANCTGNDCFLYQWEKSTNGTNWDTIPGATGLTYNPGQGMPTVTTYYRTRIKSGGQTAYSNVVSIQSQSSVITGSPDCWKGQTVTYYYTGGNPNDFLWTIPVGSGTIIGPSRDVGSVTIKWPNDGTFTLTLYNETTSTIIATLNIYVHTIPLNPGKIGRLTQSIEATSSISFSPFPGVGAIGGNCNGVFKYQWQRSTDSVTFTNLSGDTTLSLSTTPSVNAYYRRRVICSTDTLYTDTSYVQLYPYFNPGTATALNTDSVGWNSIPDSIRGSLPTGGNDTTYKFQWEYSTDQINYFEVTTNGQGLSYQPERLATTTWFRRKVINGVTTRYTNAAKVKVKVLQFYTGLISPFTKVINSGANAGTLSGTAATGGTSTGYVYQWQQSYDEVNWTNCGGTSTSVNYIVGALTKTTYYRRFVSNQQQNGYANTGGIYVCQSKGITYGRRCECTFDCNTSNIRSWYKSSGSRCLCT